MYLWQDAALRWRKMPTNGSQIKGEVKPFTTENVSGIIYTGGTILKTARSKEFMTPEGMAKAYETVKREEIDALVVIGGNGSLTGARNSVPLRQAYRRPSWSVAALLAASRNPGMAENG